MVTKRKQFTISKVFMHDDKGCGGKVRLVNNNYNHQEGCVVMGVMNWRYNQKARTTAVSA